MHNLFRKLFSKRKRGFTLVEVLVVLVILATLTAIAVPTYQKIIKKSRVSDGMHGLDMLADAQDKYFIEHGKYARDVAELNVPLKGYRPGHDQNIYTTNFIYDKPPSKNCLRAISNIGGNYFLVKNYQTKGSIVCIGPDCNLISDFVKEVPESTYDTDLCPDVPEQPQCGLNSETCSPKIFNAEECICECEPGAQEACTAQQGGVYDTSTCTCTIGETSACLETIPNDLVEQCAVSNPDEECGTRTTHYICNESTGWHVRAQVSDCVVQTRPQGDPPDQTTSDGCLKRAQRWVCDSSGWSAVPTLGNWESNGTVAVDIGGLVHHIVTYNKNCTNDSGGYDLNGQLLGEGVWCENCLKKTCPDGAVRNENNGKCYTPDSDFKLYTIGVYFEGQLIVTPWCGNSCYCKFPENPVDYTLACKKNSNGQYLPSYDELGCPPSRTYIPMSANMGGYDYDGIAHCLGEERKVIQVSADEISNKARYCRQASVGNLGKVATSINLASYSFYTYGEGYYSDPPTWQSCWEWGWSTSIHHYFCDPYPLNGNGNNMVGCSPVTSIIVQE